MTDIARLPDLFNGPEPGSEVDELTEDEKEELIEMYLVVMRQRKR